MSERTIKILVNSITPRTKYTFDFVFSERGISYELLTSDSDQTSVDLNYSNFNIESDAHLVPSGVLEEDLIRDSFLYNSEEQVFEFNDMKDYFASIFVTLTRMEEYGSSVKDRFDRFPVEESVLYKNGILDKAMCDRWAEKILQMLKIEIQQPEIEMQATFDIDNAYAYKFKSGTRRNLSLARDLVKRDRKRLKERREVEQGGHDPYDSYDAIEEIARRTGNVQVFWLTEHKGKYDRNLRLEEAPVKALIQRLTTFSDVAVHPSFGSFGSFESIRSEKESLEKITGSKINRSRQHFLRFQLPQTYEDLLKAGITEDFTMGFAGSCGFRCGTARSVKWFNLRTNEITELILHPFVYMDGTLNEYLQLSIEESKVAISKLYEEVKTYGGTFRFIWHNETIGNYGKWKGWQDVLNFTLNLHYE